MMQEQEILQQVRQWLEELFEIDPEEVQMDTHLFEDLDIDSIDAIDLIVKIRNETGKQVKPEQFKEVRYIKDVVKIIESL
ncbi:acyl carrier protein [Neisseriaceae bacterium PsAf]|nr:acyl carrier protein [Neisseriaceae bacterium PsAf]